MPAKARRRKGAQALIGTSVSSPKLKPAEGAAESDWSRWAGSVRSTKAIARLHHTSCLRAGIQPGPSAKVSLPLVAVTGSLVSAGRDSLLALWKASDPRVSAIAKGRSRAAAARSL
jgi:hypothetical protein